MAPSRVLFKYDACQMLRSRKFVQDGTQVARLYGHIPDRNRGSASDVEQGASEIMRMKQAMWLALAASLGGSGASEAAKAPSKSANCPITRTIYAQPGVAGVTAGFSVPKVRSGYASDLVFWLKADGQTFWYNLSSPNGYGGLYITPQRDPSELKASTDDETPDDRLPGMIPAEGEEEQDFQMMFDAFDEKLVALDRPPLAKDKAPAYLFARELGPLFHYAHNGGLYTLKNPVGINIAFWRPVGCAKG